LCAIRPDVVGGESTRNVSTGREVWIDAVKRNAGDATGRVGG